MYYILVLLYLILSSSIATQHYLKCLPFFLVGTCKIHGRKIVTVTVLVWSTSLFRNLGTAYMMSGECSAMDSFSTSTA